MPHGASPHAKEPQAEVLAALAEPTLHGGHAVRRIDTHAAAVFLAGDRAIKIKRAVRFPFLDYSTLERRKAACEAEIAVNRPLAPQIYRGVVAITREADGTLAIGGRGTPVEWAVEMRRFDDAMTLDKLADRGSIDAALADRLARAVAAAHRGAPRADAGAWIDALARFIDQNDAAFRTEPELFPAAEARRLTQASRDAWHRLQPLLRARGEAGFIRRLHGDLHLGNIALIDGEPVLFDAIEFDPLIAAGDVLYDLAFLLMDLIGRDLRFAANIVLNRYLQEDPDPRHLDALAALPLFLSVRAAIRAKVTAARIATAAAADGAAIGAAAVAYFRLAQQVLSPPPPTVLAIGGLSGTGKSVLARAIAPALGAAPGAVVLRSDVERKHLFGVAETAPLPAAAYRPEVGQQVYAILAQKAGRAAAAGHAVVVDAVYARAEERAGIAAAAPGIAFHGLFLTADLDTRLARVTGRTGDASDADRAVVIQQSHYDLSSLDWPVIDASGTPAETLALAQAALSDDDGAI